MSPRGPRPSAPGSRPGIPRGRPAPPPSTGSAAPGLKLPAPRNRGPAEKGQSAPGSGRPRGHRTGSREARPRGGRGVSGQPGHLTWVLVTGHLLVLGIQRPRRPGLFPQLHVWVPVGRDETGQFTGGQARLGSRPRPSRGPHGPAGRGAVGKRGPPRLQPPRVTGPPHGRPPFQRRRNLRTRSPRPSPNLRCATPQAMRSRRRHRPGLREKRREAGTQWQLLSRSGGGGAEGSTPGGQQPRGRSHPVGGGRDRDVGPSRAAAEDPPACSALPLGPLFPRRPPFLVARDHGMPSAFSRTADRPVR